MGPIKIFFVFQESYYDRYYERPGARFDERDSFERRFPPMPPRDFGPRRDFLPPPPPPIPPRGPRDSMQIGLRGPPESFDRSGGDYMFSRRSPPPQSDRYR